MAWDAERLRRDEGRRGRSTGAVAGHGLQGLADLRLERAKLRVLGRDDAQPLERQARADQVAELPPRDGASLGEEERAVAVLDARRRFLGEVEHASPVARLLAVGLAKEEERALVLGVELQRLFEEARADLEVLVAKHPARPEGERHGAARLRAGRLLEGLTLRLLERVEAALLGEQPFVERGDLLVRGVGRVGAREQPFGLVGRKAPSDPRRTQERARLRARRRRLRSPRGRAPGCALAHVLASTCASSRQALASGFLPPLAPKGAGVRRRRFFPVALVAEHVAQLDQQRARAGAVAPGLQLQLEELLDHVELAETPVDAPRGLEALDQRRVELVRVLKVLERLHAGEKLRLEDPA